MIKVSFWGFELLCARTVPPCCLLRTSMNVLTIDKRKIVNRERKVLKRVEIKVLKKVYYC